MNQREQSLLMVTCYGHFISHFNMLVFPAVLLPLASKFNYSMTQTLGMSFWMYLLFGITALPWGIAADKFGAKPLLALFYTGAGICGVFTALTIDTPYYFILGITGIGLFSGIYHPAGLGWIAKEIKRTSRGLAYNGMFGNLGLAVAPIMAGLVNHYYGVKAVYLVVGVLNLLGLVGMYFIKNKEKKVVQEKKITLKKGENLIAFLILLISMMLGGIVYRGTSVTLPAYFELNNSNFYSWITECVGNFGSANVTATLITSLIYLVGMLGQYCGGRFGEKYDLRKGYLLFHIITIPAALAMSMTTDISLVMFAMIHSFFLLGMQPLENTLVARLTPPKMLSSAFGLKFVLTFGVGALSIKMVEFMKIGYGFNSVYQLLSLVSTLLVISIVILMINTSPMKS